MAFIAFMAFIPVLAFIAFMAFIAILAFIAFMAFWAAKNDGAAKKGEEV